MASNENTRDELYGNPLHPYTRRLLEAAPRLDGARAATPTSYDTDITLPDGQHVPAFLPDPMRTTDDWQLMSVDDRHDHYVACEILPVAPIARE